MSENVRVPYPVVYLTYAVGTLCRGTTVRVFDKGESNSAGYVLVQTLLKSYFKKEAKIDHT